MRIDIATLFPKMCETVLNESIIGRAIKKQLVEIKCHNIRDYTQDKHRRVDDSPYGGGMGMVMQAEPIYQCYLSVSREINAIPHVMYPSPKGKVFTQGRAIELVEFSNIFIICGHYEGVDERIIEEIVNEEISIGDYVITGGELPALTITDAIVRMLPGVLSNDECFREESHFDGTLEYPQYTRPYEWHGKKVPDVLMSGHHKNIENWRKEQRIQITREKRPDLFERNLFQKNADFEDKT